MKDRLEKFLLDQGLKSGRFAQIMGVQPSNITHIISGRSKPGFEFISNMLINFPDLNPDWLLLGVGEMYRSSNQSNMPTTTEKEFHDEDTEEDAVVAPIERKPNGTTSEISSIVVFYSDGTFSRYDQR